MSPSESQPLHDVRLLHDCRVPMRDGVTLSADVYLPLGGGPLPTIAQWTPYESARERFIDWGVWYASRGYAAVIVDVRGRYESGGAFDAYLPDGADAVDTLEWAAASAWCNGRIGTWGRSYGAIVQWQLMNQGGHPSLVCAAPHVIMDDYFDDCHYVGGAFQLGLSLGAALIWTTSPGMLTGPMSGTTFLNDRVLRHLPLVELDVEAVGREIPFWREWHARPTKDAYWNSIAHRPEAVTVPIFQQCGWYDAYPGATMRTFSALEGRVPQRVLMGPWSHEEEFTRVISGHDFGPEASRLIREDDLRWYDTWLKELDSGLMDEPPISLFVMGANRWRHEQTWPLAETELVPFFLHSGGRANTLGGDGSLSTEAPGSEPADTYDYDPADPVPTLGGNNSTLTMMQNAVTPVLPGPVDQRPIERRDDVLCYTSSPLEADLEVTGPLEAVLYVASSAPDTDFVVRLSDVYPDGRALFLAEGVIRARYRHGYERTELLEPGEPTELQIRMYPTSNLFRRGHRLRVDVTSSSFPRWSRNLNTGEDVGTGTRMQIAHQTVLHSSEYPSRVVLPVIPS